jgi:hypothetical protein
MIIFRVGWPVAAEGEHGQGDKAAGLPNPKAMRVMSRRTWFSALVAHVTTWNGSSDRRRY